MMHLAVLMTSKSLIRCLRVLCMSEIDALSAAVNTVRQRMPMYTLTSSYVT